MCRQGYVPAGASSYPECLYHLVHETLLCSTNWPLCSMAYTAQHGVALGTAQRGMAWHSIAP